MKKSGLGRGYEALLSDNTADDNSAVTLKISEIEPNSEQPRRYFEPDALQELADNIKRFGLLQPIVVRPLITGGYQIVAGERRWRASRMAGLTELPAVVRELSNEQVMEIALIENIQREDLNPIELAEAYRALMDAFSLTQEQVAEQVGKSRSAVANTLRLLELTKYSELIINGTISAGHARALLSIKDERTQAAAVELIKNGAPVRQIERMAKAARSKAADKTTAPTARPTYYKEVQLALTEQLGRRVSVVADKKKGTLSLEFYGEADLKKLMRDIFGEGKL